MFALQQVIFLIKNIPIVNFVRVWISYIRDIINSWLHVLKNLFLSKRFVDITWFVRII